MSLAPGEVSSSETTERILITRILATNVLEGLDRLPESVHVSLDVNGTVTKTAHKPPSIRTKDPIEWEPEIFLPSERSAPISFRVYASSAVGHIPPNDVLLRESKITVGELLDRNGQIQFTEDGKDSVSGSSLRVILERRAFATNQDSSELLGPQQSITTTSGTRFSPFQTLSSLFNRHKHPRIFALIVAIDKYKSQANEDLIGCKSDGKRFQKYLTGMLGVPSSQIVFLADEHATREAILYNFNKHFTDNPMIIKGDAMIFFYAGHGSQIEAPAGWVSENNKVEAICPHDEKTIGRDGKDIQAIPDRTINGLMRKLASVRGDNIIAIFDCCHSGGASRSNEATSLRARSTPAPSRPPPLDLDRELWELALGSSFRGTNAAVSSGFYKASESHVLLAACRSDEVAWGDKFGGFFTRALVDALRLCSLHDTTYTHLFEQLRVNGVSQHPLCLGANRDRLLFGVNRIRDGEITFKVSQRGDDLCVSGGSIHGVIVGTEFAVTYGVQTARLRAVEVDAFECLVERGRSLDLTSSPSAAVVSNWNHPKLKIHSSLRHSSSHFTVVPADQPADVVIREIGSKWELERLDSLLPLYSSRLISVDAKEGRLDDALNLVANFNSYLFRPDRAGGNFTGEIKVQLKRVEKSQDEDEVYPVGQDFLDVPSSWIAGMEVKEAVVTDLDAEYCLTFENSSDVDLYPYLFYFDPGDYSVQAWYLPPSPTMLPPMGHRKEDGLPSLFAYGYGGFGTDPIKFYLPPGRTIDSGILKVFFTNTYVDMSYVAQSSISELRFYDQSGRLSRAKTQSRKGIWECKTFILTCKA